jgi:hypothetical protein
VIESRRQIPNTSNKLQIEIADAMQMATTSGWESMELEGDDVAAAVFSTESTFGSMEASLLVMVTMLIRR